jgi:wobble nucleotide-excising tRNase
MLATWVEFGREANKDSEKCSFFTDDEGRMSIG